MGSLRRGGPEAPTRVFVTVAGYGSQQALHSMKAVYQWSDGRIAFERLYHLHSGTSDDWTTHIVEEAVRIGPSRQAGSTERTNRGRALPLLQQQEHKPRHR